MVKKILVVDDDPVVVRMVEALLKNKGYEVIISRDGLEALARIKKDDPDLVVLDILMPEINGYDVCCELRFNRDFKKIPILILSETEKELDAETEKRANIKYLHKPFEKDEFLKEIDLLLATASAK